MNKKISQLLIMLFESRLKNYSEITIDTWMQILKVFPPDQVVKALSAEIISGDSFPDTKKIIDRMGLITDPKSEALQEWNKIRACARDSGAGQSALSDLTKQGLQEIGGMIDVRMCNEFQRGKLERDFISFYTSNMPKNDQLGFDPLVQLGFDDE